MYRKSLDRSPRLPSVQMNQTPGLYAGPGIYPGCGFYHNMSTLCYRYFIQKSSTSVYQYQYFVYYHDVLKVDAEDKIKLLNSWFVANKLSVSLDKTCYGTGNLPCLVCGTWLVTGARLRSVQMDQTPGLYAGLGFYPRIYGTLIL